MIKINKMDEDFIIFRQRLTKAILTANSVSKESKRCFQKKIKIKTQKLMR